jgi:hypothetical protein
MKPSPSAPSAQAVERAVARLASQASKEIKEVMTNAKRYGATGLVEACRLELAIRGSNEVTGEQALAALKLSASVDGKGLEEIVEIAFSQVPPSADELRLIRLIADNPNSYSATLQKQYGGAFNLDVGHLVYFRYGLFRKFLEAERDQSSILISKDISSGRTFYNGFKPEVINALKKLQIL